VIESHYGVCQEESPDACGSTLRFQAGRRWWECAPVGGRPGRKSTNANLR